MNVAARLHLLRALPASATLSPTHESCAIVCERTFCALVSLRSAIAPQRPATARAPAAAAALRSLAWPSCLVRPVATCATASTGGVAAGNEVHPAAAEVPTIAIGQVRATLPATAAAVPSIHGAINLSVNFKPHRSWLRRPTLCASRLIAWRVKAAQAMEGPAVTAAAPPHCRRAAACCAWCAGC